MRSVLILNPTSGASTLAAHQGTLEENMEHILATLRTYGIEPEIQHTTPEDTGSGLARLAAEAGVELVIAVGGDGTQHAVASGLIGTKSTMGIIPLGTMNNIAHSLEIPETIEEACTIIGTGVTGQIDVGRVNGQVFLEVAGIGLEAALFPAAEEIKSYGWTSTVRGFFQGLGTLFAFKPSKFMISFDGRRTRRFRAVQISVCNSPYYGARLQFAPNARMNDGFLDVLIYKNFSKLEYIFHAISISRGQHALEPRVTHRLIRSIRIRSDQPVPIHADGVPQGETPVTINVEPGVLQVRVLEKVMRGPHMVSSKEKRTQKFQPASSQTRVEEKGPLYVK